MLFIVSSITNANTLSLGGEGGTKFCNRIIINELSSKFQIIILRDTIFAGSLNNVEDVSRNRSSVLGFRLLFIFPTEKIMWYEFITLFAIDLGLPYRHVWRSRNEG